MFNQVILIGRVVADPEIKQSQNEKNFVELTLAIQRPFKNSQNQYDTDFIKVVFWEYMAINIKEYCEKGSIVSVKGRIQTRTIKKNDVSFETIDIIGEHIIFINKPTKKED